MAAAYLRWTAPRIVGRHARLALPDGGSVGGFRSFSEFYGTSLGFLSLAERRLIRRVLPPDGIFLDVGANVGVFTGAAAALSPRSRIHSFEAAPSTFEVLRRNVEDNGWTSVTCENFAVSDSSGEVSFRDEPSQSATNRIVDGKSEIARTVRRVRAVTLDEYCEQQGVERIALLKIDVEGWEPKVLAGAIDLFRRGRVAVVLIEICPSNLTECGTSIAELVDQSAECGLGFFELSGEGTTGRALSVRDLEATALANVLVLPSR